MSCPGHAENIKLGLLGTAKMMYHVDGDCQGKDKTRMAPRTRKKAEPVPVEETPVTEEWDGVTEDGNGDVPVEEGSTPKRRGRVVSPLIVATRNYEEARKASQKAQQRIAKVQPLIEALDELKKAEAEAYEALQAELGKLSQ